jgi:hypothetical protein
VENPPSSCVDAELPGPEAVLTVFPATLPASPAGYLWCADFSAGVPQPPYAAADRCPSHHSYRPLSAGVSARLPWDTG